MSEISAWGGDPTAVGWAITAGYGMAVLLLLRRRGREETFRGKGVCLALAIGMLLLGVNKQMDLQMVLRQGMKPLVRSAADPETARWLIRTAGLWTGAVIGITAGGFLLWWGREFWRRNRLLLAGCGVLGVFLAVRTASMLGFVSSQWDSLLATVEGLGVGLIAMGGLRAPPPVDAKSQGFESESP